MEDPRDLLEQAERWRRLARFHDASTAVALVTAARTLELKADWLAFRAPAGGPGPSPEDRGVD